MAARLDWSSWDPWKALWEDWTRIKAEKDLGLSHIQFVDLYNFFRRQVKALGIDPYVVDVKSYLDPMLTYGENKTILAELMKVPPTTEDYEAMYESYKTELTEQVKEKYPEVWAEWEKRIKELEREVERLPRVERQRQKFKKLAEKLRFELEETERRREQEKIAVERRVAPVKLRILKAFREGIIDYTTGSVVETRDIDWAMGLVEKGLAKRVAIEVPVEIKPPPPVVVKPPPPKVPPPKVLPPVPEVCPIDGTPLELVEKAPLFIPDPLLLTSEEEYFRARAGIPIPTVELKMIDVPPTMRVWMCRENHYFERDAAGRLVQRTQEHIYRKILRETAKLRRITYPPPVPIGPPEVVLKPPPLKPPAASPKRWLLETKGFTWGEFLSLPNEKRKELLEEYTKLAGG